MFSKILIANRGEIAYRIMRTAHRMDVRCVAVYSDADAKALHVEAADEAYRLGPAAARDSYLKIPAIIEAADHFFEGRLREMRETLEGWAREVVEG